MKDKKYSLKQLVYFAESEAYCPCCEGVYDCEDGCTIKEDSEKQGSTASEERYTRMIVARFALNCGEHA